MINENFYDEMKEHLIANINDTFTLNLAMSLLEDSKKYKVDSEFYKQALNEIREIIKKYDFENYAYLEQHMIKDQKECLQIIDKVLGDSDENKQ